MTLTNAEWSVMECLWEKSPQTVVQLAHALRERAGWAKSTSSTMVTRMAAKGLLRVDEGGKARLYSPAVERKEAVRGADKELFGPGVPGQRQPAAEHHGPRGRSEPGKSWQNSTPFLIKRRRGYIERMPDLFDCADSGAAGPPPAAQADARQAALCPLGARSAAAGAALPPVGERMERHEFCAAGGAKACRCPDAGKLPAACGNPASGMAPTQSVPAAPEQGKGHTPEDWLKGIWAGGQCRGRRLGFWAAICTSM